MCPKTKVQRRPSISFTIHIVVCTAVFKGFSLQRKIALSIRAYSVAKAVKAGQLTLCLTWYSPCGASDKAAWVAGDSHEEVQRLEIL